MLVTSCLLAFLCVKLDFSFLHFFLNFKTGAQKYIPKVNIYPSRLRVNLIHPFIFYYLLECHRY